MGPDWIFSDSNDLNAPGGFHYLHSCHKNLRVFFLFPACTVVNHHEKNNIWENILANLLSNHQTRKSKTMSLQYVFAACALCPR